eukprot:TRINITY_DN6494_c0_g1_i1.p2 TRINITY_DN6494_c0_g1~~TRINITY_DN6494_c0_g1_i1.p2  ORF type:complete len:124 (+),score=14.58 TRINITY_DN6494_c0_g1_i1:362-733(+)
MPGSNGHFYQESSGDSQTVLNITYYQPNVFPNSIPEQIVAKLYELGSSGDIMPLVEDLEAIVNESLEKPLPQAEFASYLSEAEERELVLITKRQFGSKAPQRFASLKIKKCFSRMYYVDFEIP